jgi:flagellar hook assembly protein FlgD
MKKAIFAVLILLAAQAPWDVQCAEAQTVMGDSLIIHLKSGERVAIPLSNIQKITFDTASSSVVQLSPSNTSALQVSPSFPNPSRSGTKIEFSISTPGNVSIAFFNSKGNFIRRIDMPNCPVGQNEVTWDGLDDSGTPVPSGEYFYEVRYRGEVQTKQMVVIK